MSEIVLPVLLPVESKLEMKEEMSMKFLRTPRGDTTTRGLSPATESMYIGYKRPM